MSVATLMRITGCYLKIIIDDDSDARETFMHRSNKTSNRYHLFLERDISLMFIFTPAQLYTRVSRTTRPCARSRCAVIYSYIAKAKERTWFCRLTVIDEYLFFFFHQGIVPVLYVRWFKFLTERKLEALNHSLQLERERANSLFS